MPDNKTSTSTVAPEGVKQTYGPVAKRKCRDVFFLLLFILFWGGMAVIGWKAVKIGDPQRLQYGTDMYGNLCGSNNLNRVDLPQAWREDCTNKPFLYYPTPFDTDKNFCVSSCPNETSFMDESKWMCEYDVNATLWELNQRCWPPYQSKPIFNRCIPTGPVNGTKAFVNNKINAQELSTQVLADVLASWKWILAAAGVAVALGFLWLILMRIFAGVIVWLTIFAVYIAFFGITAFIWWQGKIKTDRLNATPEEERLKSDVKNARGLRIAGYILVAICAIFVLLLIWMRRRIALAIGIIKQATKAIAAMPSIILFPAFVFFFLGVFTVYWIVIATFIATAGSAEIDTTTLKFKYFTSDNILRGMQVYHFFGYLWTGEFIAAFGQVTIAMAVASWYWAKDKKKDVPRFPVMWAVGRVFRYHLGTIAFGSLIIAIIRFIRAVLAYVQKRLKGWNNRVTHFLLRCLDCLFACFERFMKFINKNAYIMVAIKGDSFCMAAKNAFQLLLTNILRVGVTGVISNFLLFLGKLFITIGATLFGAYMLSRDGGLHFWLIPCVIIAIISYFIASCFMSVYEMAIDTILLSFCEDEAQGQHTGEYYNNDLKGFIDGAHKGGCCK